jgi:hypothetical protein
VLEIFRDILQRTKKVAQHREIHFHLLAFEPTLHQIRLLINRRIHNMRNVRHLRKDLVAPARIEEVDRDKGRALNRRGCPPRDRNDFPAVEFCEVANRRIADESGRTCD